MKARHVIALAAAFSMDIASAEGRFDRALAQANSAVSSSFFKDILSSYEAEDFECAACRSEGTAPPDGKYIASLFEQHGLFPIENVRERFPWWSPFTKSVAWTTPKSGMTHLNSRKLNRSDESIASTIVHERLHDFGYIHKSQYERESYCDPSYIVGVLAEVSILYSRSEPLTLDSMVCPSLCERLQSHGVELPSACSLHTSAP